MHRKRSDLIIISEILAFAMKGEGQTRISYACNLNYGRAGSYIDLLVRTGLLQRTHDSGRKNYRTTQKGRVVLNYLSKVVELLGPEEQLT